MSGTTLTLKTGGSITITASQGGNGIYLAAPDATQSLSVIDDTQQAQTITWSQSLGSRAFGVADLNLTASSNANLPITYISSDSSIASIVNGTFLQVVGAGNATITATQAGNGQYQAASAVIKTVTVTKANQTIVTNGGSSSLPNLTMDNGDFEFAPTLQSVKTGTTTATGLALSYASSSSAVIEVTSGGTRLKPKGDGTATITVTQNGDSTYNAASNNNATFTITVTEKSPYSDSLPGMILWLDANDINADGSRRIQCRLPFQRRQDSGKYMGGSFGQFQHLEPGHHQFTTRPGGKLRKTGTRIWIHSGECRGTHDSDDAKHSRRQSKLHSVCGG